MAVRVRRVSGGGLRHELRSGHGDEHEHERDDLADAVEVAVPRLTPAERVRECGLNELAWRLSWASSKAIRKRKTFLQRGLDGYRSKIRTALEGCEETVVAEFPVYAQRPGRKCFSDRRNRMRKEAGLPV
jgi:hypothetical protein